MGLDLTTMAQGWKDLFTCLLQNRWPTPFWVDVVGLKPSTAGILPTLMLIYIGIYALASISALTLRFCTSQRAITPVVDKVFNALLSVLAIPGARILKSTFLMVLSSAASVEGGFHLNTEGIVWILNILKAIWMPAFVMLVILALMSLPLRTCLEYLTKHGVAGIPWMIHDVGLGWCLMCVAGTAMARGSGKIYLLAFVFAAMAVVTQMDAKK